MSSQLNRLAASFARQVVRSPKGSLCAACIDVLGVTSAGITLFGGREVGPLCVSDARCKALEDLQFLLGEGPCQDAFADGIPVHAPRLADDVSRWPTFVSEAAADGFRAVFAYPLIADRVSVGVLTIYNDASGELAPTQVDDCSALSGILATTILRLQADAGPGIVPPELDDAVAHRAEIHQAAGMASVQLSTRVGEALDIMRAYAFANGRSIGDVAADIVARRLTLPSVRWPTGDDR